MGRFDPSQCSLPKVSPAPRSRAACHCTWDPHELPGAPCNASVSPGKAAPTPFLDTMRPDLLLKMTLGGMTLVLLQTCAPSSGPPDLTTHFFAEFDATKDGPFGSRDFHHLRPRFKKACPYSHVRYELQAQGSAVRPLVSPDPSPLMASSSSPQADRHSCAAVVGTADQWSGPASDQHRCALRAAGSAGVPVAPGQPGA